MVDEEQIQYGSAERFTRERDKIRLPNSATSRLRGQPGKRHVSMTFKTFPHQWPTIREALNQYREDAELDSDSLALQALLIEYMVSR